MRLPASVKPLETEFGYMTSLQNAAFTKADVYHVDTVWPFEQALIHVGATKHSLSTVADVSARVTHALARFNARSRANLGGVPLNSVSQTKLPIDRTQKNTLGEKKGTVDAMADLFKQHGKLRLIITPEGTRSKVTKWKTGFYHVALKAGVPIALGFMDYEKKECGIDKIIYPSGDYKADMKQIMDFYSHVKAKHPENFSVDVELAKA